MLDSENFLAHYGVLGMKWGVRKDRSGSYSSDYARKRRLQQRVKKSGIQNLSNKELKELNYRRELEKNYKKQYPNKIQAGYNYITGALAVAGTAVAIYNIANSQAGKAGAEYLKKLFNR